MTFTYEIPVWVGVAWSLLTVAGLIVAVVELWRDR